MKDRNAHTAPPTLEDVATLAGVSTATVSRCLNSPDRVMEATRLRVMEAVQQLGYAPNFGARALAAKRTNTIGAIIPTMDNAIFARGLQAFQEQLSEHGLTLLVATSSYRPDLEEEQIRNLLARGADALLLIGFDRPQSVYDYLERRGVPYVVAWNYRDDPERVSAGFDNRSAMKALGEKVIGLGHRRLAIITAPQKLNDRARDRVSGALEAAAAAGIDPDTVRIIETPYAIENGAAAMSRLMQADPAPTAVMCGNDVLAVGAIGAARALGLRVPEDVSVTGFDDIEIAGIVEPKLTTVHVPHRAMGRHAADMIAGLLKDSDSIGSRALETRLVLRQSLAAAPQDPASP